MIVAVLATLYLAANAHAWWDSNYSYRRQITVTNNDSVQLAANTIVAFTADTQQLITDGKLRDTETPNDWRIVYDDDGTESEIAQLVEGGWDTPSTETWFRLQADIPAGEDDGNYYVYYGYSGETTSPSSFTTDEETDPLEDYTDWDDRQAEALDNDATEWGAAQGVQFNPGTSQYWKITRFSFFQHRSASGSQGDVAGFIFDATGSLEGDEIPNGKSDVVDADNFLNWEYNDLPWSGANPKVKTGTQYYIAILPNEGRDATNVWFRWAYDDTSSTYRGSACKGYGVRQNGTWAPDYIPDNSDRAFKVYGREASNDDLSASLGDESSLLFKDDFGDDVITGWTKLYGATATESGGVLTIPSNADTQYSVTDGSSWTIHTFSAEVKGVDDDRSGIAFRVQNGSNYYLLKQEFGQDSSWDLYIQKVVNGTPSDLATPIDNSAQVNDRNTFYTFKVILSGDNIKCYIDGVEKFDVTDSTFSSGTAGLWTEAQTNGEFDDVEVTGTAGSAPQYYEVSVGSDSTTSGTFVDVNGGSLTFTPSDTSEIWILFFSAKLGSTSNAEESVEVRYLVNDVEHGYGGTQVRQPTSRGPWQHFYRITGTTAEQTVKVQFRDVAGTGTIEDLKIIAFKLPDNADFQFEEHEASQTFDGSQWHDDLNSRLQFTPGSAGDYLIMVVANGTEQPGGVNIGIRLKDDNSPPYWPVFDYPAGGEGPRDGYFVNARAPWQSFFLARIQTLDQTLKTFTIQVSGSDADNAEPWDTGSEIKYTRIMAFRTDVFDAVESQEDTAGTSTTSTDPVVKSTLTTAAPPDTRDYITIQSLTLYAPSNSNDDERKAGFEADDLENTSYNHVMNNIDYTTSFGYFDAVTTSSSVKYENTFSTSNASIEVYAKESVIHVLRLPVPTTDDVTVSSSDSQTSTMDIPSTDQYVGGKFVITENTGSRDVTSITITEHGTVDGA